MPASLLATAPARSPAGAGRRSGLGLRLATAKALPAYGWEELRRLLLAGTAAYLTVLQQPQVHGSPAWKAMPPHAP